MIRLHLDVIAVCRGFVGQSHDAGIIACAEINQCVGYRAGVASMAWRTTQRFSTTRCEILISTQIIAQHVEAAALDGVGKHLDRGRAHGVEAHQVTIDMDDTRAPRRDLVHGGERLLRSLARPVQQEDNFCSFLCDELGRDETGPARTASYGYVFVLKRGRIRRLLERRESNRFDLCWFCVCGTHCFWSANDSYS